MAKAGIAGLPVDLDGLCASAGIETVPLSAISAGTGMTASEVCSVWQNENGHLMPFRNRDGSCRFKIAYNDGRNHVQRKNFTVAEELAHYILGHHNHGMYRIYEPEAWDEAVYRLHEESARIGAGLLLCPPPVFYEIPDCINAEDIGRICDVSGDCAAVRNGVLYKYRDEIVGHPMYAALRDSLSACIDGLLCPARNGARYGEIVCLSCGDSAYCTYLNG